MYQTVPRKHELRQSSIVLHRFQTSATGLSLQQQESTKFGDKKTRAICNYGEVDSPWGNHQIMWIKPGKKKKCSTSIFSKDNQRNHSLVWCLFLFLFYRSNLNRVSPYWPFFLSHSFCSLGLLPKSFQTYYLNPNAMLSFILRLGKPKTKSW